LSPIALVDKSTAAWKLVSSLKDIIAVSRADKTYPKWSDHFLAFCEQTADATREHLKEHSQVHGVHGTPSEKPWHLPALIKGWELLHTFIKPVLDADNLKVPYPLVHFLTEHIGELEAVRGTKLVFEISPDLNYFQHQHTDLRIAIQSLQTLVHGPLFQPTLGFLALPCSQFRSLFMNCVLYHEVGHFIAEETGAVLAKTVELREQLKDPFEEVLYWAMPIVQRLMEELFADLVAVKLVGAAYTLSYMELLRLVTDLSHDQMKRFFINHPADALRFREQLTVLKKDGWDKHAAQLQQWAKLEEIAAINDYLVPLDYQDDPDMAKIWTMLIERFCRAEVIETIHATVDSLLEDRENPRKLYAQHAEDIQECLEHGIVPSNEQSCGMPHPVAVINGGTLFLLSRMDALYRIVPSRSEDRIGDRAFLENRVEMWCLKAIENWLITKNQLKRRRQAPPLGC